MANPRMIEGVLRMYINALIVNTLGDPVGTGETYPDYEEVLERYSDFDDDDLESNWIDDSEVLDYGFNEGDSGNEQSE